MLTLQTYKLLNELKEMKHPIIQSIDEYNNQIKIFNHKDSPSTYLGLPLPPKDENLIYTYNLDEYKYLLEKHYIVIYTNPYISFTHLGYRIKQINIITFCWHVFFSIIVPFIVAYYTSR